MSLDFDGALAMRAIQTEHRMLQEQIKKTDTEGAAPAPGLPYPNDGYTHVDVESLPRIEGRVFRA